MSGEPLWLYGHIRRKLVNWWTGCAVCMGRLGLILLSGFCPYSLGRGATATQNTLSGRISLRTSTSLVSRLNCQLFDLLFWFFLLTTVEIRYKKPEWPDRVISKDTAQFWVDDHLTRPSFLFPRRRRARPGTWGR